MGFLKKLIKQPLKDVKKVAKVVAKVDPVARTGMKLDPLARKVTGIGTARKQSPASLANSPAPQMPPRVQPGQGNAPAPRQAVMPPKAPTIRKSATRSSMSSLGAGKYRIK